MGGITNAWCLGIRDIRLHLFSWICLKRPTLLLVFCIDWIRNNGLNLKRPAGFSEGKERDFSQFNDQFIVIRSYAKKHNGLFSRMAVTDSAFIMLQYLHFPNHLPKCQVKCALLKSTYGNQIRISFRESFFLFVDNQRRIIFNVWLCIWGIP